MHAPLSHVAARMAGLTAILLMVPLVAMQFTEEVNWGWGDFVAAAALLFGAGMAYGLAARRTRGTAQKVTLAVVVLFVLGTVWAELAVGLFT